MKLTFHDAKTRVNGLDDRILINASGVITFSDHAITKVFPIAETSAFSIATNTDDQSVPDTSVYLVRNNKNGDVPILKNASGKLYINFKAFLNSNKIHFPAKIGFEILSHEGAKVIRLLTSLKGQLIPLDTHPEIKKKVREPEIEEDEEDEVPVIHHSAKKTVTTGKNKAAATNQNYFTTVLSKEEVAIKQEANNEWAKERTKLMKLAKKHKGVCVNMAKEYGIADSSMLVKLRRYGIDINEYRPKK